MDSLFYENIPGEIQSKEKIKRFGYTCYDIVNKTAVGDLQQYQIFITPLELIIFKTGGKGKFIKKTSHAETFFESIEFLINPSGNWSKFETKAGGFSI